MPRTEAQKEAKRHRRAMSRQARFRAQREDADVEKQCADFMEKLPEDWPDPIYEEHDKDGGLFNVYSFEGLGYVIDLFFKDCEPTMLCVAFPNYEEAKSTARRLLEEGT